MKLKKRSKIILISLLIINTVLVFLANRDLIKIYGGLTARVDSSQFKPHSGPLAINHVNILATDGSHFIADQTIYMQDGLIVSIDEVAKGSTPIHTINGQGKYLIPGLTDAHVHLFKSPNDLLLYIANGVTQIRELIGEPDHLVWRQEIQNGRIGPEMFIASPRIGSFGLIEGFFMSWSQGFINLNEADEAINAVKDFHQQGYDGVKIYSQINKQTYQAVTTTAHDLGMKVVGHVPWDLTLADIYTHQDSVGHLEELMNAINREFGDYDADSAAAFLTFVEERSAVVADELVEHDMAVSTTLWLVESFIRQKLELDQVLTYVALEYENPGISEWSEITPRGLGWLTAVNRYKWPDDWDDNRRARSKIYWETYAEACQIILKNLVKKGVKIMAGTDANLPVAVPGFSLHDEFISLNHAGMTPAQILNSATVEPARWLDNNAGKVLPGYKANLVLLDKNPLEDISNTQAINSVILNGRLLDRTLLDELLAAVKAANDSSRKIDISQYLD